MKTLAGVWLAAAVLAGGAARADEVDPRMLALGGELYRSRCAQLEALLAYIQTFRPDRTARP